MIHGGIPEQGDLKEHSLAKILVALKHQRASGRLKVSWNGSVKEIYVKDGSATFATSSLEDDRLGEMLVKAGKITAAQYEESVRLLKSSEKRQGAILVELGYLMPKDLFWGVKYQVKDIICSLFQLESASYAFSEEPLVANEVITLKISTENLIYECVRKIENWTRIKRELPPSDAVLSVAPAFAGVSVDELPILELAAADKRILSLVDGKRTIGQIIEDARMNSFEVMKTLYVLWSAGILIGGNGDDVVEDADYEGGGGEMEADEQAFLDRLQDLYQNIDSAGPADILGVNEASGPDDIKRAYYRLVKEFHPDRVFHSADKDLKHKVTVVFDAVTKSYKMLQDETKRREYFASLGRPSRRVGGEQDVHDEAGSQDSQANLLRAQFSRAIEEFKKGDFWMAADLFKWVVKEDPKNAKAWSYLSLSLTKVPKRLKEAEEALHEAISLEPFNSEHFANLGLIYLKAGLKLRAKSQFERALRLDSGNERARIGLDQIE